MTLLPSCDSRHSQAGVRVSEEAREAREESGLKCESHRQCVVENEIEEIGEVALVLPSKKAMQRYVSNQCYGCMSNNGKV